MLWVLFQTKHANILHCNAFASVSASFPNVPYNRSKELIRHLIWPSGSWVLLHLEMLADVLEKYMEVQPQYYNQRTVFEWEMPAQFHPLQSLEQ